MNSAPLFPTNNRTSFPRRLLAIAILALSSTGLWTPIRGQAGVQGAPEVPAAATAPALQVAAVGLPSSTPGRGRLQVFLRAPFTALQFVKGDSGFVGRYEVTVAVEANGREANQSTTSDRILRTPDFAGTRNPDDALTAAATFSVPPGEFRVLAELRHHDTQQVLTRRVTATVRDFWKDGVGVGDVVFSIGPPDSGTVLVPVTERHCITADFGQRLIATFETFQADTTIPAMLTWKVAARHTPDSLIAQRDMPLQRETFIVAHELVLDPRRITAGPYILSLSVTAGAHTVTQSQLFSVRWHGYPFSERPLDLAAAQATHLLNGTQRKRLQEVTGADKQEMLESVWRAEARAWNAYHRQTRTDDPARQEYYARVDYADQQLWNEYMEGWRTDQGRTLILNGPPDRIIRNDHHPNLPPHEIWIYEKLNKRYTFMDRSRRGELKFISVEPDR